MCVTINIKKEIFRPQKKLLDPFVGVQTVVVSDSYGLDRGLTPDIRPVIDGMNIFGTALTVESPPGDNLTIYKAIEISKPGDVLVISTKGHILNAIWGDVLSTAAKKREIAGMVTDGVVRDIEGIAEVGISVFARGVTPNSCTYKNGGKIGYPVSIGSRIVNSGDLIVGDCNGVVVIPFENLEKCGNKIPGLLEKENMLFQEMNEGNLFPSFIQKKLSIVDVIYDSE